MKFKKTLWGTLKIFQVPCSVFEPRMELQGSSLFSPKPELFLGSSALKVLLVLYDRAKSANAQSSEGFLNFKLKHRDIQERAGLSKNAVTKAVQKLSTGNFMKVEKPRKKLGAFAVNKYIVCDPKTGEPLEAWPGQRFLYRNGVPYFNLPTCFVRETTLNWSLARVGGSALKLYVCIAWLANKESSRTINIKLVALRRLCGMSPPSFRKAFEELQTRGLIWTSFDVKASGITLCDPYTGEPLHTFTPNATDDPANYTRTDGGRANFNTGDPAQTELLVRAALGPNAEIQEQSNGDLKICCPFHDDKNPSCSVSPSKRCFHCFGCNKNGRLTHLLMKLKNVSEAQVIRDKADVFGLPLEYHEPDRKAEAIYHYHDLNGNLIKQVLRYKGKKFMQRRPVPTGWVWSVKGVKPILYNLPRVRFAKIVVIVEGEKDADRVNALQLMDRSEVIATTSGGSESWSDELGEYLTGKQIIIIPDSDNAGQDYKEQVIGSLKKREIQHCVIDLGAYKDISDYLDAGHSKADLIALIYREWSEQVGDNTPFAVEMALADIKI